MKPNKKADDLLRDKLNSYSSPVRAGLFDAIDKKRKEQSQPKKTPIWTWKSGLAATALLLMVGLSVWHFSQETTSTANTNEVNHSEVVAETLNQNTLSQEKTTAVDTKTQLLLEEEKSVDKVDQNTISNQSKTEYTENREIKITKNQTTLDLTTNSLTELSEKLQTPQTNENRLIPVSKLSDDKAEQDVSQVIIASNEESSVLVGTFEETTKEDKTIEIAEESTGTIKEMTSVSLLTNSQAIATLYRDEAALLPPAVKCGWTERKVFIYLDALGSVDMAFRTLTPKENESNAYAVLRNRTEGMQESFSLGFRASAVTKNGFAARTGLIYSQIQEPFAHRIYTEEEFYIETTDQQGVVIGRDTLIETRVDKFASKNRHRLVDIPLILGYEIDKAKYNLSFNGGTFFNITATQQGTFISSGNEIVDFSSDRTNRYEAFKNSVGFSLYGSIAVNYKITPALHFIFEPYGRYYLESFTTDNHELEQNYLTTGLQFGLRMKM